MPERSVIKVDQLTRHGWAILQLCGDAVHKKDDPEYENMARLECETTFHQRLFVLYNDGSYATIHNDHADIEAGHITEKCEKSIKLAAEAKTGPAIPTIAPGELHPELHPRALVKYGFITPEQMMALSRTDSGEESAGEGENPLSGFDVVDPQDGVEEWEVVE